MMRIFLCLSLLLLPAIALAEQLPPLAEQVVDYHISAKLDTTSKLVDGKLQLIWRNPSNESVPDLWFHLYLNAFKNNRSTFFKESGGQLRGDKMAEGHWGWIDIASLRLADGPDLTQQIQFTHPDDDNAEDQTVIRVPLPKPVGPRESITLDISFKSQLPEVFARTGFKRNFFMVGQWFPKIGVYEPAGMRGRKVAGWNCHQFHANSEFYADYGHYLVDITLPSSYIIGATGKQTSKQVNADGTATYTFEQANIHDFSWTADPNYVELRRTFSAVQDVSPSEYQAIADLVGRPLDEVKLSDVEIILLLQPAHLRQAERHFQAAKLGIKHFGLWYGRYPYPTLTVVDPAFGGSGAGGMEYPTLITAGTSWLLGFWPFDKVRMPEMVTIHEFGHQFWYALVGNNEFEEAWLDEGINSYSTGKILEIGYGKDTSLIEFLGLKMGEIESIRMQNSPRAKYDIIRKPAWTYLDSYGFYSYAKPEIVLRTLENRLGERTMARVMRTFSERFRFKHPSSDDFYAVANEVSQQDLGWYFQSAIESSAIMDFEVTNLVSKRVSEAEGVFDRPTGRVTVTSKEAEKAAESKKGDASKALWESTFIVRRSGDFIIPVDVEYKFEGQPPERTRWDGRDRWIRYRFERNATLEWVQIDPEHKNVLDVNWLNNSRRLKSDRRAVVKWSSQWLFWMQSLFSLAGI